MRKYTNQQLISAEVIEMAKEVAAEGNRGQMEAIAARLVVQAGLTGLPYSR